MKKHLKRSPVTVVITSQENSQQKRTIQFVNEGTRFFFNQQHLLLELERGERALYDFLAETMDSENNFYLNSDLRSDFKNRISTVTSKKRTYSKYSVDQYLVTLVTLGLVLKTIRKGLYTINPRYAFNGTETIRKSLLKKMIETRMVQKLPIDKLIDTPLDYFLSGQAAKK